MHGDTPGSRECVDDAVHAIHRECLAECSTSLQWKHNLGQCCSQSTPLEDDTRQRVKRSKFLENVFRCTPDRLGTTMQPPQNTAVINGDVSEFSTDYVSCDNIKSKIKA